MKIITSIIFSLLLTTSLIAQDVQEINNGLLSVDEMKAQPNLFLENIEDAIPNEEGKVKLFIYKDVNGTYESEEQWYKTDEVYQLYATGVQGKKDRFPLEVFSFPKLQTLVFPQWQFTKLPATISTSLPNLQYLDLQGTPITTLPQTLKQMKYLEYVNLTGTKVSQEEISRLKEEMPKVTFFQ